MDFTVWGEPRSVVVHGERKTDSCLDSGSAETGIVYKHKLGKDRATPTGASAESKGMCQKLAFSNFDYFSGQLH